MKDYGHWKWKHCTVQDHRLLHLTAPKSRYEHNVELHCATENLQASGSITAPVLVRVNSQTSIISWLNCPGSIEFMNWMNPEASDVKTYNRLVQMSWAFWSNIPGKSLVWYYVIKTLWKCNFRRHCWHRANKPVTPVNVLKITFNAITLNKLFIQHRHVNRNRK